MNSVCSVSSRMVQADSLTAEFCQKQRILCLTARLAESSTAGGLEIAIPDPTLLTHEARRRKRIARARHAWTIRRKGLSRWLHDYSRLTVDKLAGAGREEASIRSWSAVAALTITTTYHRYHHGHRSASLACLAITNGMVCIPLV